MKLLIFKHDRESGTIYVPASEGSLYARLNSHVTRKRVRIPKAVVTAITRCTADTQHEFFKSLYKEI